MLFRCPQPIEHCGVATTVFDRWLVASIYPVESSVEPSHYLNSATRINALEVVLKMASWRRAFTSPVDRKAHNAPSKVKKEETVTNEDYAGDVRLE